MLLLFPWALFELLSYNIMLPADNQNKSEIRCDFPLFIYVSCPVFINRDEFVVAPFTNTASCLYKYNINTNKWAEYIKYPWNLESENHSLTYNRHLNELYLYGKESSLIIINLDTEQFIVKKSLITTGLLPSSIMVNNQYHIIGGTQNTSHYTYNATLNSFESIHTFNDWAKGNCNNGLIHIQSKDILLLFGGYDPGQSGRFNKMWSYDLKGKQWNSFGATLPYEMQSFGYILTKNERYVIIFGGIAEDSSDLSGIYFLDLKDLKWYQCQQQLPLAGMCYAASYSEKEDDLLVYGYIREFMKKMEMNIPMDIYQLVLNKYKREFVHILSRHGANHQKIEIQHILNTANPMHKL